MMKSQQLKEWLMEQIITKKIDKNELLPTEEQMQKQFNFSKMTVRKAIQELKQEGMIYSIPGKGFIVLPFWEMHNQQNLKIESEFKTMILPTNTEIPDFLLNNQKYGLDLRETHPKKNWIPFLSLTFEDDKVTQYSLNWYYVPKNKTKNFYSFSDYTKIENLFNNSDSLNQARIFSMEEVIENDFALLELDKSTKMVPTMHKYYLNTKGNIDKIKITRYLPDKFNVVI